MCVFFWIYQLCISSSPFQIKTSSLLVEVLVSYKLQGKTGSFRLKWMVLDVKWIHNLLVLNVPSYSQLVIYFWVNLSRNLFIMLSFVCLSCLRVQNFYFDSEQWSCQGWINSELIIIREKIKRYRKHFITQRASFTNLLSILSLLVTFHLRICLAVPYLCVECAEMCDSRDNEQRTEQSRNMF